MNKMSAYSIVCILFINWAASPGRAAVPDLSQLNISGQAVVEQLTHLATFTDDPTPAVTRILFTGIALLGLH